jgi:hypothetical protein
MRYISTFAVIATTLALSACGGSNSNSASKANLQGCYQLGLSGAAAQSCAKGADITEQQLQSNAEPTTTTAQLTAAEIDARIIDQAKAQFGITPTRVDCGSSTDIASGDILRCNISLPNGKASTFNARVTGGQSSFTVVLG